MEIETLADTNPDEILRERNFLLKFDYNQLCNAYLDKQTYWATAIGAATMASTQYAQ